MRVQSNAYPVYCDEKCVKIVMKGVWTPTKAGATFCQKHGAMVSTCKCCGREFHSERSHTATCGNACRMKLSRLKRKGEAVWSR